MILYRINRVRYISFTFVGRNKKKKNDFISLFVRIRTLYTSTRYIRLCTITILSVASQNIRKDANDFLSRHKLLRGDGVAECLNSKEYSLALRGFSASRRNPLGKKIDRLNCYVRTWSQEGFICTTDIESTVQFLLRMFHIHRVYIYITVVGSLQNVSNFSEK